MDQIFLVGVQETAEHGVVTLEQVLELKSDTEKRINDSFGRRIQSAQVLLRQLFQTPYVTVNDVAMCCKLSLKSANDLVLEFVQRHWLREKTGYSRNRIFAFTPYMSIFQ